MVLRACLANSRKKEEMALKIRMARGGSKKRPVYRVVVTDSRNPRDGKFIEKLGMHNPLLSPDHPQRFAVNEDRVRYWLSVGAQSSERVNRYLAKLGIEKAQERFEQTKKNQPKKKAQERLAAEIEKKKAAAEQAAAEAAAAAEPTVVEEIAAPAEEVASVESSVSEEQSAAEETSAPESSDETPAAE
jgi:small subunit ribosomal protein S16